MAPPTQARAPRPFRALFRLLVAREEREPLLAELEAAARGVSRGWWAVQLVGLLRPSILWRLAIRPRLVGLQRSRAPGRLVTSLLDGVRHSVRSVRRNGPVSIAAILILGLGIGAATTLFAVLDAVMLSPLPHPLPRFQASVMSALGALGLLVAVAGCFAVLSYLVTARRREMGIRVALGASYGRILALVFRHGGLLVGAGLLVGLAACAASTRLLEGMLYGLSPLDPASYAIAIGVLALAAGGSILWPALRAAAVSPATALRDE